MHRWFHQNLNNVEAERLLLERGGDGSFLVRPSHSSAGHFSLSIRRRDKVTHIKIRHTGEFFTLHGDEQFATLPELIQYYMENFLGEKNGEIFMLKKPLNTSTPTTERWFHGSISGKDAEKLIREKGVSGSFLVRESQSKIGDYVLTVRTKDELSQNDKVSHVMIRNHNNKYDVYGGEKFNSLCELVEHYKRNPMVETTGTVVNMKYPFNTTRITALDIDARVAELSKENNQESKEGFWEEFEQLQHQESKILFNRKIGQHEWNLSKNRYKNILPYDYTRVILKKPVPVSNITATANNTGNSLYKQQQQQQQQQNDSSTNSAMEHDYINANYIKLVDDETSIFPRTKPIANSKVYIATQGPLMNTVADFWWMVWQEKSDCIAMVTREVERGKNKCYRYWPTPEQGVLKFGPLEVKLIRESFCKSMTNNNNNNQQPDDSSNHSVTNNNNTSDGNLNSSGGGGGNTTSVPGSNGLSSRNNGHSHTSDNQQADAEDENEFVYREFELKLCLGAEANSDCLSPTRRIFQGQYNAWPDQSIPASPNGILTFWAAINRRPLKGPMVVHCSAGIGRSGTLIVIDMLIDQLKQQGLSYEIDIQRIVKVVRAQRSGLVQTAAQYKFIYLAIQDYINNKLEDF